MRVWGWLWLVGGSATACGGVVERPADEEAGGRDPVASTGGRSGGSTSASGGRNSPTTAGSAHGGSSPSLGGSFTAPGGSSQAGSPSAPAPEGSACYNDIDCPSPECGGQVCDWTRVSATPVGQKVFYCARAGNAPRGTEGWCTTDTDCKCWGYGARCIAPYCTFTRPEDAP